MEFSLPVTNGNNRDSTVEDVDDMTFLRHPRQGSSGYMLANTDTTTDSNTEWEDKRRQLLAERRAIEERTLESSKVSLGLVYETEKTGIETAEELVRQREQLDNVEEKLDSMNSIMRVSQKHLTSMKSIFGGFKNYFSKNETNPTIANKSQSNGMDHKLDQNLSEIDLGLGRLKNLALGLGSEIEEQNQSLDRITGKAERAEDTLQHQNRQMKRILKN
ncbi:unnamed protein product [Oppiella nova]|uniref:t-SNARE coiled-coil homology domain-containing protein n=1 Tax=Oppiella nova TaxID=334625 RepID=A0A7R9LCC8_9ACAR|nr:unnamed protein product [Oppiella nova]CAG2162170.1 unnamed protein product [Oppiella nova]